MANKKRSASSGRWLQEHFSDKYVQMAQKRGFALVPGLSSKKFSRAIIFSDRGMTIVDLGAAPGGWSQYAVNHIGQSGRVIACDLLPMDPIVGVDFLQGDFRDENVLKALLGRVGDKKVQVVMSDMAPNMSGTPAVDIPRAMYLVELALDILPFCSGTRGSFIVKVFQGDGFDEYLREVRSLFTKVKIRKPDASRARSREVYIVATGWKV